MSYGQPLNEFDNKNVNESKDVHANTDVNETTDVIQSTEGSKGTERNASTELNELKQRVQEVLHSKMDEFHMLGYDAVTMDEIWECVTSKYKQNPPFHRLVNDIYTLKVTTFMNWLTVGAYKGNIDMEKNGLL